MAVNLSPPQPQQLFAIDGISIGTTNAGIRQTQRPDLTVLLLEPGASVAAVLTQNRFCAAPVQVCRQHLDGQHEIRALLINTGCANAGTGLDGLTNAQQCCLELAKRLGLAASQVLPFSTGVIMEPLPLEHIVSALGRVILDAKPNNWWQAAHAIMTTDTVAKGFGVQLVLDGALVSITGIAKGSGMICPNMATMLGFMATNARIAPNVLRQLTQELADASFNRITVDGDTSTNDAFVVIASQRADHALIDSLDSVSGQALRAAMLQVAQQLAQAIVRDGEGASKFIRIQVEGGRTRAECDQVARAIAHSPLVKTAFFASDPNLGRILAAIGNSGIPDLDPSQVDLYLDDVHVAHNGARHSDYCEQDGQRVMQQSEITLRLHLGRGEAQNELWTCDLSHQYVSINADYRS